MTTTPSHNISDVRVYQSISFASKENALRFASRMINAGYWFQHIRTFPGGEHVFSVSNGLDLGSKLFKGLPFTLINAEYVVRVEP